MKKNYTIYQEELGPMQNFVYFIKDNFTNEIAVVDPAWDTDAIIKKIKELKGVLKHILLTHSHDDHINGIVGILDQYDVPVHMLKKEYEYHKLENLPLKLHYGNDKLLLGKTEINFLHTPGHTPGSVCYHLNNDLITGDTMFVYGCGHCRLGGNPHQLFSSLQKLKKLPFQTCIHPGHNYSHNKTSTIKEQIKSNPFLIINEEEQFVEYRTHIKRSTPYEPVGNNRINKNCI